MRINIIAVGKKMPEWVLSAYEEFIGRFPRDYKVNLQEISAAKRNVSKNVSQCLEEEGVQILKAIPSKSQTIALDVQGELWTTEQLAKNMSAIATSGFAINFLIGGPDGLSRTCLEQVNFRLSLSRLTFPHPLVRVILIEQLYRAQSLLNKHPYHRA